MTKLNKFLKSNSQQQWNGVSIKTFLALGLTSENEVESMRKKVMSELH